MLRLPLQVRRAARLDARIQDWTRQAKSGRGEEARKARQRLKELHRLEALFPRKPFLGRNVPKFLIPPPYRAMGVSNLFRNDLPDGWRVLHTVMEVDGVQAVIGLDAMGHREYDRTFGYEPDR